MYAKTLQYLPNEWPLNLVICSFEVYKTEVQWFMCMFLLVNDMLQNKCLLNSTEVRSISSLCVCAKLLLLCVLSQPVVENVCI